MSTTELVIQTGIAIIKTIYDTISAKTGLSVDEIHTRVGVEIDAIKKDLEDAEAREIAAITGED